VAAQPKPQPVKQPEPASDPLDDKLEQESAAVEAPTTGYLAVDSDLFAMVYMGGRRLGSTPIARMALPPGTYTVRAVCRDTGSSQTREVEVEAGKEARARFNFRR